MDDNTQLPVDLSSGTDGSSDDKNLNDSNSTNFPEDVDGGAVLPGEIEPENQPEENQPVADNTPTDDQLGADLNETSVLEPEDTPVTSDTENLEETDSGIDISKEVLTDDADDTESFLDDTEKYNF
jgi:hypothetical protein